MPISREEKIRTLGLVEVERLQSEGLAAIEDGGDANVIADRLLALSQRTSDPVVSEMAMLAHVGIASGQSIVARRLLATVNDQIASATNTFTLAARIAQEGESNLTFPFIAGRAASLLDLLETLENTVRGTVDQIGAIDGVGDLIAAIDSAKDSVVKVKDKAERIVSDGKPDELQIRNTTA